MLTFHLYLIRRYVPNNDAVFLHCDTKSYYNFDINNDQEWFVDKILAYREDQRHLEFEVQ